MKQVAQYLETSPTVPAWVRLNQSATLFALIVAIGAFTVTCVKFNDDKLECDEDRISKAWDTLAKMAGRGSNGSQVNVIQILLMSRLTVRVSNPLAWPLPK